MLQRLRQKAGIERQRLQPLQRMPLKDDGGAFFPAFKSAAAPVELVPVRQRYQVVMAQFVKKTLLFPEEVLHYPDQAVDLNRHLQFFLHFPHNRLPGGFHHRHPPAGQRPIRVAPDAVQQHPALMDEQGHRPVVKNLVVLLQTNHGGPPVVGLLTGVMRCIDAVIASRVFCGAVISCEPLSM